MGKTKINFETMPVLRFLKFTFYSLLERISSWVYESGKYAMLQSLRKINGVSISPSFVLGKYSGIVLKGTNNKLLIGDRVRCKQFCNFLIYPNAELKIDKGVFMNNYCSISCLGKIEIGENTLFGEGVKLYDHNHKHLFNNGCLKVLPDDYTIGNIKIGKNCWIGSNVTILKNVEIGDNVIVGANCLVYRSIPSNTIVKMESQLNYSQLN